MKITYIKNNEEQEDQQPAEQTQPEIDWKKLGHTEQPPEKESNVPPSPPDLPITTLPDQSPRQISPLHDPISVSPEATYANKKIQSKQEAMDWILGMLGYPLVTAELTEEHLNLALTNALQLYTEYAYFPDKYIMESTENYEKGYGLNLAKYNVTGVSEISVGRDSLFFYNWPFMMNRSGYQGSGTLAGSFITFHNMKEFQEMVRRLCARDYDFNYSRHTKYLSLIPEPPLPDGQSGYGPIPMVLTVQVEPPIWELYGDLFVRKLALAYAKIILGQIRSKFEGITLPGGGNVSREIGTEGKEELEKLEEQLKSDRSKGQNWFFA